MLIVVPLGLLATALVFDAVQFATGNGFWTDMSDWMIAVGVIAGLIAAPFGFVDWLAIPAGTRAKRIGAVHGAGNVIVVALYGLSWLMRTGNPAAPETPALAMTFLGGALAM